MVQRAEALLPRLRERAAATEALGHLPPETVADFVSGGFFRVLQPNRFGGMELDYGRVQLELCSTLGQACGSSAWVQMVVACHAWCLAKFPDAAQQAVWGEDPETLVASAFGFTTARADQSKAVTGSKGTGSSRAVATCASGSSWGRGWSWIKLGHRR